MLSARTGGAHKTLLDQALVDSDGVIDAHEYQPDTGFRLSASTDAMRHITPSPAMAAGPKAPNAVPASAPNASSNTPITVLDTAV